MSRLRVTRCRTPLTENKEVSRQQRDTVPYGLIKDTGYTGGKATRSRIQGGGGAEFAGGADNSAGCDITIQVILSSQSSHRLYGPLPSSFHESRRRHAWSGDFRRADVA